MLKLKFIPSMRQRVPGDNREDRDCQDRADRQGTKQYSIMRAPSRLSFSEILENPRHGVPRPVDSGRPMIAFELGSGPPAKQREQFDNTQPACLAPNSCVARQITHADRVSPYAPELRPRDWKKHATAMISKPSHSA